MNTVADLHVPHECCQKCRCYYHPSERSQHICIPQDDEIDNHPSDEMSQYRTIHMTTDITELAQSLKAAADSVIKNYDCEWFETGSQICTVHKSKVNLISANPANILALVEALESAAAN